MSKIPKIPKSRTAKNASVQRRANIRHATMGGKADRAAQRAVSRVMREVVKAENVELEERRAAENRRREEATRVARQRAEDSAIDLVAEGRELGYLSREVVRRSSHRRWLSSKL